MFIQTLLDTPSSVYLDDGVSLRPMRAVASSAWELDGARLELEMETGGPRIWLEAPQASVSRLVLRWRAAPPPGWRFLGDAWERGYGDLEWRAVVPERVMPWYVLACGPESSAAWGVMTAPAALAYWQVDGGGIRLTLDTRCGGEPVRPGARRLELARVRIASAGPETPLAQFARDFCRLLNPAARLPAQPVYGCNDWYYRYGHSSAASILADARLTADLSPDTANRPFTVIDAGWSNPEGVESCDTGIRERGNERFPDLPGLAEQIRTAGARPGIWVRPLVAPPGCSPTRLLRSTPDAVYAHLPLLDPSIPENLESCAADFRRLASWGYELIKHDFSSVDILGRWGVGMGAAVTSPGWAFQDRTRTSAEIILAFYRCLRDAAGPAYLIGCNTIGHLGAGLFELQRTGDDTSGREWERTRKMGINTLAFRAPQHETFFLADADCVGLSADIPWKLNRQWLDLLARSGTPLFVSADPAALGAEQRQALREAFTLAARPKPGAEPLDWLDTLCPARWRLDGQEYAFDWYAD